MDSLRAAASTALANGAPDSAVTYLRRALAEPPAEPLRAEVLLALGFAESYAGGPARAADLEAALASAADVTAQISITLALGRMLQIDGRNREAMEAFDRTRARLGSADRRAALMLEGAALGAAQFDADTADVAAGRMARLRAAGRGTARRSVERVRHAGGRGGDGERAGGNRCAPSVPRA